MSLNVFFICFPTLFVTNFILERLENVYHTAINFMEKYNIGRNSHFNHHYTEIIEFHYKLVNLTGSPMTCKNAIQITQYYYYTIFFKCFIILVKLL